MAQIRIMNGELVVLADLLGRTLHPRNSVVVKLAHVVRVEARPEPKKGWLGHLRAMLSAGTHIPGIVQVGTFSADDGMVFYALRDRRRALVIELEQERFRRLIVEPERDEEPEACARRIREAAALARPSAPEA
jgi:hypothetical protein